MDWQQSAVEELFGASARYDDACSSFGFDVSRDGLRMLVTLFVFEDAIYVSIWREGISAPIFTVVRESCTHARVAVDLNDQRCLEVGSPEHPIPNMGVSPILTRGIRVYVEPHFRLVFIDAEARGS